MPNVSLIVPVHNTADYLEQCFASVAAQTLSDFEVIAVDDGSTDDSWTIIQNWMGRDVRFKSSFQTAHLGISNARNQGLDRASGEFVAFIDSDDHLDPLYCIRPFERACQEHADIVHFGSCWIYPDRRVISLPSVRKGMDPRETLVHATATVWDKLYRRAFLDSCGFRFANFYHEDVLATPLLMTRAPRTSVLDLPLYNYVRREGSICGLKVNSRSADMLQIFEILMEESLRIPDFEEELQYLAVRNLRDMVLQWSRCNEAWALECLEKARTLLEPLANLDYSNPYLIRERANAAEGARSVGLGKRLQRGLRTTFRSLRGALGIPRSKGV